MTCRKPEHPIAFIDLATQQARLRGRIDAAIAKVLDHGQYILGPEVAALEARLRAYCGSKHAFSCASGTDALALLLMARGLKPGDAVLVPSFTFVATVEVVALLGATPVFVDCDPATYNLDPNGLEAGIAAAEARGLEPVGVISVDLFGLPADYAALDAVAARRGMWVINDAAQSFGARGSAGKVGGYADGTATSFYPAKPLGCYGDGGAVFTDDDAMAEAILSLRVHGQGKDRYAYERVGINGRLDTLQAAILLEKIEIFDDELAARHRVAERYGAGLAGVVGLPPIPATADGCSWAQFTVRAESGAARDRIRAELGDWGVPTAIYYPVPIHVQGPYALSPRAVGGLPVTEDLAARVFSLPMHPYLNDAEIDHVVAALCAVVGRNA